MSCAADLRARLRLPGPAASPRCSDRSRKPERAVATNSDLTTRALIPQTLETNSIVLLDQWRRVRPDDNGRSSATGPGPDLISQPRVLASQQQSTADQPKTDAQGEDRHPKDHRRHGRRSYLSSVLREVHA